MRSIFRLPRRFLPVVLFCLGMLALLGFAAPRSAAATYYVATTGSDSNAGTLAAPFLTIQHGINTAVSGDTVTVEDGTYTGPGDVDLDFGGRNLTVQSQNGATKTIIDCYGGAGSNHRGFYLHSGELGALIDGFTIKDGYETSGGGIYSRNAGVTVQYCTFLNDQAVSGGGGVCLFTGLDQHGTNVTVTVVLNDCMITGNGAEGGSFGAGYGDGGGVQITNQSKNSTVSVTNCTVTNNTASYQGGGIYVSNFGTVTLTGCALANNTAQSSSDSDGGGVFSINYGPLTMTNCTINANTGYEGGGVFNDNISGTASLINCAVFDNTSVDSGGGIYNFSYNSSSQINLIDCSLTANTASTGGGIYNLNGSAGPNLLTNDILYGDNGGEIMGSSVAASYCDIQGGIPSGTIDNGSNINVDPLFVSSPANLHLQPGSPCLGAGTASGAPTTTLDGYTRPNPPSIGAYELAPVPPPTNLTATAGVGKVTLTWTAPAGVSGATYSVFRGTASGAETFYKTANTATNFVNTYVTVGTTYYYTVQTVVNGRASASSNEASATPTAAASVPAAPTNVNAVAGVGKVTLTWTASPGTVTSYSVYRGTSASSLTFYKTAGTATSFVNASVVNGTTYYYAIVAINSTGSSPQSTVVSATPQGTLPGAPQHLTAVASGGKITLTWTASSGTVTSYSVYRGTASGVETFYKTANTATMFVNSLVTAGTKYYYYITALNSSGSSAASNEASATP